MASYPVIIEPTMSHTRYKPAPLAYMPNMWQPSLHQHNVYHSSHVDVGQIVKMPYSQKPYYSIPVANHEGWKMPRYPSVYHSSASDQIQSGWRKWAAEHPDWYARRAEAWHPDWYARRVATQRHSDTKERLWPYELTSRPTERRVYGMGRESPRPVQRGYQATPHDVRGQVQVPRWGLYHPPHYEEPSRVEPLPALHMDENHH